MIRKTIAVLFACFAACSTMRAAEPFVTFTPQADAIGLKGATVGYSEQEYEGVKMAIQNLREDMKRVLGVIPAETTDTPTILIGTLGRNKEIDRLKLADLKGKREKFIITTVGQQLVIAGSDKRGTIYGIYELSRQLGVSPWYWWADAPIARHNEAYIVPGTYTDGEPAVEFRGIFLNDEAPCLTTWVKNTFGTGYGGHQFYEKVFELILRLRGNMMWPAMWGWAFYADDPENGKLADRMGVMMGTSHHEPMARNHQEYARHRREWGAWNYQTNQKNLDRFFREGIERMKGTEDIITIGMRGDGDEAMSETADTKLMERIINNQRRIIKEVTGKPAEKTTQMWALYKEVQDYYDAGLRVPDDVMILLCDDNWGNIRRVPTASERMRKGGWGIYYHVDYVGAPRNTKWLNVTQTQQMFEQLSLAYDFGIQRMWILNVGDLKPMEYPIQLFMDMAWNPKEYTQQTVTDHTRRFFQSVLTPFCLPRGGVTEASPRGGLVGVEAADIYNRNCQYMARVTPEMLDARTYNVETGEWRQVADDYQRLELRALRLYQEVPEEARDFYRQLILFPVQAMANLYDMYYAQAMNQRLAKAGSPDANQWAEQVKRCFRRDSLLCAAYNHDIANGKWNGMMIQKHIGYTTWNDNFRADKLPATTRIETPTTPHGGEASGHSPSGETEWGRGYTFAAGNGYVSMEAEHYYRAEASEGTQWSVYPYYGRTRSAVALTPYTQPVGDASLTYRFSLPEGTQKVKVHIIVKSTLDFLNVGGHECTVSLDGGPAKTVNFNKTLLDQAPYMYEEYYPTVARRVIEKEVELPVGKNGIHELTLRPRHPGIVFEKLVVDFGGYKPSYLFMNESDYQKEAPQDHFLTGLPN
ncbi:MAG: glycosyl hydrolase 115 family protein [Bacteroidaceae bacterium]|nr:glycosyl hydrolase 115 family protein [Bacteroidaceae bacterium]